MKVINETIPVFGDPLEDAVKQIETVAQTGNVHGVALMADHHVGYSMLIGGVAAYFEQISPSGVGYDIACGNAAVRLNIKVGDIASFASQIADEIASTISFGVGRKNMDTSATRHPDLWKHPAWDIAEVGALMDLAYSQLGTVGAGNHYVDVLYDEDGYVWIANHFGSRGLGHKIATHFIKAAGGKDGMFVPPVVLDENSQLGQEYLAAMTLAGEYAYAGRDWVIGKVVDIFGSPSVTEYVHNHHNFAWKEHHFGDDLWVVRKGATPLHRGQSAFIGGSMADISVIVKGRELQGTAGLVAYNSAPHGAGRIMSRTQAAGKKKFQKGQTLRISEGEISREMMDEVLNRCGVTLRGGYMDEAPQVYKDLGSVLSYHSDTMEILHTLQPLIVVMSGPETIDPYKD